MTTAQLTALAEWAGARAADAGEPIDAYAGREDLAPLLAELTATKERWVEVGRVVRAVAKAEEMAILGPVEITSWNMSRQRWRIQKHLETRYAVTLIEAIEAAK